MPEKFTPEQRHEIMAKVHSQNTTPELYVRALFDEMGIAYTLDNKTLPGKPDLVLPDFHTAVFVHGCFWHGHQDCRHGRVRPQTNAEYWNKKIDRNIERDKQEQAQLKEMGWNVLVIWECETRKKQRDVLAAKIHEFIAQTLAPAPQTGDNPA
jgi:DNA mismatch endonuclease (patch repair protein)